MFAPCWNHEVIAFICCKVLQQGDQWVFHWVLETGCTSALLTIDPNFRKKTYRSSAFEDSKQYGHLFQAHGNKLAVFSSR